MLNFIVFGLGYSDTGAKILSGSDFVHVVVDDYLVELSFAVEGDAFALVKEPLAEMISDRFLG